MSEDMTATEARAAETTVSIVAAPQAQETAPAEAAEEQPVVDLLVFLDNAHTRQKAEQEAKKAAAAATKPQALTTGQQQRDPYTRPIAAEAFSEITFLKEVVEPKLRGLDAASLKKFEELLRERWKAVSPTVLGECVLHRTESFLARASQQKYISAPLADMLVHWEIARKIDEEIYSSNKAEWKTFAEHRRTTRDDRNHNKSGDCKQCVLPAFTSWQAVNDTFFAIDLKNGGERGRYARYVSRALEDWRRASSGWRGAIARACEKYGAEKPDSSITLASVARGEAAGKTVAIVVPRNRALFNKGTDKEGNERTYTYWGACFVHALTLDEAAKRDVRIPKHWGAISLEAPEQDEDAGRMFYPLRDVLPYDREDRVFLFYTGNPNSPFDQLQDARRRTTPWINWRQMELRSFLLQFMGRSTDAPEEVAVPDTVVSPTMSPVAMPPSPSEGTPSGKIARRQKDDHGHRGEESEKAGKGATSKRSNNPKYRGF